jgi:signal transduction histidine kinase
MNLEDGFQEIKISGSKDDEIVILADMINGSFKKISTQTKSLRQFITDVSHEFKTPLMVINSNIDLYNKKLEKQDEGAVGDAGLPSLLASIKFNTKKLNKLLETLFLISRLEEGIICFKKEKIHLEDFSRRIISNLQSFYSEKEIAVVYKFEKMIYIEAEDSTLSILFENLITNAIKFSPKNVSLEI